VIVPERAPASIPIAIAHADHHRWSPLPDQRPPAIEAVLRGVVAVAEEVAAIVLDEASAAHGQGEKLSSARKAMEQAAAETKKGRLGRVIDGYAIAWELSRRAQPHGPRD
jgi:hypothetical protein